MRYRPVSPKFWTNPKVIAWDDDRRLLALYLLTCPHRTSEGLFRLPVPYMLADLGWSPDRFFQAFDQLLDEGFVAYDDTTSVCLIPKALKYQVPENRNQAIGAARALLELPHCPTLWRRFVELVAEHADRFAAEMRVILGHNDHWASLMAEVFGERFMERMEEEKAKGLGEPLAEQSSQQKGKPRTPTPISNPDPDDTLAPSQATDAPATPDVLLPVVATNTNGRKRDLLFEALVEACHVELVSITDSARGAYNRALKDLRKVDATPADIHVRAKNYRLHFADVALTPTALAKHWAFCASPPGPVIKQADVLARFAGEDDR